MNLICKRLVRCDYEQHDTCSSIDIIKNTTIRIEIHGASGLNLRVLIELPVISEVRVTRFLVFCVCFVDRCLSFCPFSFGHCDVCSSSFYGFKLPLLYLQTHLNRTIVNLPDKQYIVRTSILARQAPTAC